ncbi:MAG TPA: 3-oxoacyl-[acyl-carrier-protein] synthase III C-terminal domain-containing protein [Polyangiaceae bacterium]
MNTPELSSVTLGDFSIRRPPHQVAQAQSLDWLAAVHSASQATLESLEPSATRAFEERLRKVIARCACGPDKIAQRGHVVSDVGRTDWNELSIYDVSRHPRGVGAGARSKLFDEIVSAYFDAEYRDESPPDDLVHVTCTGYVSPSGAQKTVAAKGWGGHTRVTHAYHMGCYAALPAIRIAAGALSLPGALASGTAPHRRVDIVHTELCSLHLDPSNHSLEQLVVQSLFADGFVRYAVRPGGDVGGLAVLSLGEAILPDSAGSMSWIASDIGMQMTLARDVPERIAASLRAFVTALYAKAGLDAPRSIGGTVFAVHPGGPKIIDGVRRVLELDEAQVQTSRDVLRDCGNMSSATLPHIWSRLTEDESVARGTLVVSLAFGPGLTVCGGLLRKQ